MTRETFGSSWRWAALVPLSAAAGAVALLATGLLLNPILHVLASASGGRPMGGKEWLAYLFPIDLAVAAFVLASSAAWVAPSGRFAAAAAAGGVLAVLPPLAVFGIDAMRPFVHGGGPPKFWPPLAGAAVGAVAALIRIASHRPR